MDDKARSDSRIAFYTSMSVVLFFVTAWAALFAVPWLFNQHDTLADLMVLALLVFCVVGGIFVWRRLYFSYQRGKE